MALVLTGAAAALAVMSVSTRNTYRALESAAATRQSAYELLTALRLTRQHIGEIRVGLTGYVLTHDSLYLATYNSGMTGWPKDTLALERLANGVPTVQSEVTRLTPTIVAYAAEMSHEMDVSVRRGTVDPATKTSRSALLLENIRVKFVTIETEQLRLMDISARDVALAVQRSRDLIITVLAVGVVVILGVGGTLLAWLLNREFRRQLHADQERQRAFFRASPLPMLLYAHDTRRIVEVNDAALACYLRPREELAAMSLDDLFAADELPKFRAALDTRTAGRQHLGVWTHRRIDGSTFDAELIHAAVELDGRALHLAVVHDVTHRRRVEAQLRQSLKMEAVGRLAAGVAHDFSNIMATVAISLDSFAAAMRDNDVARADIEIVRQSIRHGAELTQQLLAFSRHHALEPEIVQVNAVLAETQGLIARTIGSDIAMEIVRGESVGEVRVDPTQLQQVLLNLAANARDAMPRGGTLRIATANFMVGHAIETDQGEIPPGSYVKVTVEDTGIGMYASTRARAFEQFFTSKPAGKGTGLGLSTVYGIVQQSGAFIELMSRPEIGTMFMLYFPRVRPGESQLSPHALEKAPDAIHVVDDDETLRRLIAREMRAQGYHVIESADGSDALRVAESYRGRIRLLITDIVLPGVSGVALAETIASVRSDLRVLFISGFTDERVSRSGKGFSASAFLRKPFDLETLNRCARELLEQEYAVVE